MKRTIPALLILTLAFAQPLHSQEQAATSANAAIEAQIDQLLGQLTLDEKLTLLEHQNPAIERLGLPAHSWWNEALHGVARNGLATVYPMPIALAATFNPALVEQVYSLIADEAAQKYRQAQAEQQYGDYTGLTFFTPNINIFRDPRWGRGMETFGEDPCLTAHLGLAAVRGLQGPGPWLRAAACLKHLAVHSGPEGLRHQFNSLTSPRDLMTTYLPAFEYIISHSDVQQVMCGYNRLEGEPCCTNRHLLHDLLRQRWGYDGILVTDCWALNDCWEPDTVILRHRTHPTAAAAAAAAFGSEVDLECGSGLEALRQAVSLGLIDPADIDRHVRRVLRTRLRLRPSQAVPSPEAMQRLARQAAANSLVLLKNNNLLPLANEGSRQRIALLGPNAADSAMLLGNYNGTPPYAVTIRDGISRLTDIAYFDTACHLADTNYTLPSDFWQQLQRCDVVLFCGGLSPALEGEELPVDMEGFFKGDRTAIELPAPQRDLIHAIKQRTGKPIVLILCTGSAIALQEVADDVQAILVAWYGGQEAGNAVADALYGFSDDFGRLPVTFYRSTSQLPDFDKYDMQGRTYRYMEQQPLYPFGHGLSYATYHYEDLHFDRSTLTLSGTLQLDASRASTPNSRVVIQVYATNHDDPKGPHSQLVAMQSHTLSLADETASRVRFVIPIDPFWLRHYDEASDQMAPPVAGTRFTLRLKDGPTLPFTW
ncbi:MAG: glycoside hydrolase family 3 C-terminal domain-containing protein [Bacteroidales bacterium]|nr:glycoside hydrolase family 3 C-terminal domain-containing protein [Bacteroidales bacterium]